MTRPKGLPPTWATDTNFSSGALTGQPTKLDPGAAVRSRGWYPGKRRPATWDNYMANRVGAWLDHYDAIEVKNFIPGPTAPFGSGFVASGAVWAEVLGLAFYAMSDATDSKVLSTPDGLTFTAQNFAGVDAMRSIAVRPSDGLLWCAGEEFHVRTGGGSWSSVAVFAPHETHVVAYDAVDDVFWFGGESSSVSSLKRGTTTTGSLASVALTGLASETVIDQIAISPTKKLAMTRSASAAYLWTGLVSGSWTRVSGHPFQAEDPSSMIWSSALELFVVTTANGRTYTSADGVTWSLRSSNATWEFRDRLLVARGPLLVAVATIGGLTRQVWSRNEGASWSIIMPPIATASFVADLDNRLVWCEGVANPRLFYGLRV